jgi:phage shock protein C
MVCESCSKQMNEGNKFCSGCGSPFVSEASVPVRGNLTRPRYGRVIAGVCAGFAQQYGWDPIIVRLVLCGAVLAGFGSPVLAYLIAWIVMPNAPHAYVVQAGTQATA